MDSEISFNQKASLSPAPLSAFGEQETGQPGRWQRHVGRPRIDLSNLEELQQWASDLKSRGEKWLVLDLKGTVFMSLPVIRFIEELGREVKSRGGALALVGMADKTHRIFEIYGSFKNIFLVEKIEKLRAIPEVVFEARL